VKLGDWNGTARTFTVPLRDVTGIAAMRSRWWFSPAQEAPGTMLGATVAALN